MNRPSSSLRVLIAILSVFLLGACQTVHKDLEAEMVGNSKPRRETSKPLDSAIQVPDLDERKEDTQFLSQIDRLEKRVFDLTNKLKEAEAERKSAIKLRNAAQQNESVLANQIDDFQTSLESALDRERKLKERLLRSELESVRYQQTIADMKIRELTRGDGN